MGLPDTLKARIDELEKRMNEFIESSETSEDEDLDDEDDDACRQEFIKILVDTCTLVREEAVKQSPHVTELVEAAEGILSEGVEYAYGGSEMFDFMPSWAHDDAAGQPLIKDNSENKLPIPSGALQELMRILRVPDPASRMKEMTPVKWKDTVKLHPKSSKLARFRPNLPTLTPTAANPIAMRVYDARCEVMSTPTSVVPIDMIISRDNACLALLAAGGYKNRSPALEYYLLDGSENHDSIENDHSIEPGLAEVAHHVAIHENRRLILIGDEYRVKSYAWAGPDGNQYKDEPLPVHTLASGNADGPINVLPNGNIIRAGRGQVAVWNMEELPTHGADGTDAIGEENEDVLEDTWRDDPDEIETSSGSIPNSHIKFTTHPDLKVDGWMPLVQPPATMLCYSDPNDCFTLDLEHEGKIVARYLGHGGIVNDLSTSSAEPQIFLTAGSDGFARLYDLRTPLPVLTFDACGELESCDAAVLAYPDGIPTVFTGTGKAEQIKLWDVRARAPVYELSTGNNQVQSLAWDSTRNFLYAATECSYMDRMGYRHDYRCVKSSHDGPQIVEVENGDNDDGYEDEDDEGDFDEERAWPKNAWHDENYFGYVFDAGNHRIYRYAFKEDPNASNLPVYGDAVVGESSSYW
ncbi:hypothetical protein RhiJN_11132 [Ceratobasidium sp. AG-Ba]|nr:hypothetical protein RhiJN_11132 [Ceratobasidium sp. AG-Ba]QRW11835.1 hypothetical protein RhiLY_10834 [Ceratobasidium sp. AG-Ba]